MKPVESANDTPALSTHSEKKVRRAGAYLAAIFLGGLFGLAVVLLLMQFIGPGKLPEVSTDSLAAARAKWEKASVTDYDLEVVVSGRQPATYELQVRRGVVLDAKRDGQPLKQQRTWGTWSVEGMWETIERDLTAVELIRAGKADSSTPQLLLRGVFDSEYGFPLRYQRTEIHKFGSNQEISWEVRKFQRR